jgi:RNase P subunit RPR2
MIHIRQSLPSGYYRILCDTKRTLFVSGMENPIKTDHSFYRATCIECAVKKYYMLLARGDEHLKIYDLLLRFRLKEAELKAVPLSCN